MEGSEKQYQESQLLAHYSIGPKLRTLRNERRMTLSRLANETGLSTALLSKIETQHMIPTLLTLLKISHNFGVGLDYFFADAEQHSLSITRKAHIAGPTRGNQIIRSIPLHTPKADDTNIAEILEFPPGITSTVGKQGDDIEIAAYVIQGALQVDFAGIRETLNEGDCVTMKTTSSIIWGASGDIDCKAFVVTACVRKQRA